MSTTALKVKLTFPEELVKEPLIAQVVQLYGVLPNIRRASVEHHFGWMVCELLGEPDAVQAAVEWMRSRGVSVDSLGDVVVG